MNRILFEKTEIRDGAATVRDARAAHIRSVLHGEPGDVLKTGEVDGLLGTGEISAVANDGAVTLRLRHDTPGLAPWADLILAPPRPRVLKRLLPQLASLGVGRIVLVGAKKVEKDFWGATLLKEANYRPLFVEGLMQGAASSAVPVLATRRAFRRFIADELDAMFPPDATRRIVAHPYGEGLKGLRGLTAADAACLRGSDSDLSDRANPSNLSNPNTLNSSTQTLLLAVGPEGGWTDDEVALLEAKGFARYSLGPRILRTDTALIALLARLAPRP